MAKEAVARAVVWGSESAVSVEGGSQMLVRRRGSEGRWREEKWAARAVEVVGLNVIFEV